MRRLAFMLALVPMAVMARHQIVSPDIKSLQVVLNDDWMSMPVLRLGSDDVLNIGFDELSHNYRRFVYRVEPCNPDWTACDELFESDWLSGFNNVPIEDYVNSLNTTVLYTHYSFQFPNEHTSLRLSGNYRLRIVDEEDDTDVAIVELRVAEPVMSVGMGITTNTDIDLNGSHQQVEMTLNYNGLNVTNHEDQIKTFVMQNGREDNMKQDVRPNYITPTGLKWEHNKGLIFDGGNEYHRFEILDPSYTTLGLAMVAWDEDSKAFHAFVDPCEPQHNYVYVRDADGAFLLRNSDNREAERVSEYVYVHYKLVNARAYDYSNVVIDGNWTVGPKSEYVMEYDPEDNSYNAVVLQKLGYYNYQLRLVDFDGTTHTLPEEGSFFQTENRYQALVYYKGTGERSWRLVGFQEKVFMQ